MGFSISIGEIIATWRLSLTMIAVELIGGCIGLLLDMFFFGFISFVGFGILAMPIGFAAGLVFQLKWGSDTWQQHTGTVLKLGLIAIATPLFVCVAFAISPRLQSEVHMKAEVKRLGSDEVSSIDIMDEHRKLITRVLEEEAIESFLASLRRARYSRHSESLALSDENSARFVLYVRVDRVMRIELEARIASDGSAALFYGRKNIVGVSYGDELVLPGFIDWWREQSQKAGVKLP